MLQRSQDMRLADNVAFITGSGSGIGRATALRFAAEGAAVAVFDRHEDAATSVAREITEGGGRAIACQGDVTDLTSLETAVATTHEQLGPISILVANAAISQGDDILTID